MKKFQRLMILKLKKINFCAINPEFLKDADIEKVLLSNNISSTEKKYKYFLGYLYDNYKVNSLHKMLKKTSSYVKSCHGQTKWMYFFIENDDLKNIILFVIMSAPILKKNLMANLSIIKTL